MKALRIGLLVAVAGSSLQAGEEEVAAARLRAIESRGRCFIHLANVAGVNSVSYAGSGTDYRLLIAVRDFPTKAAARQRIGGDAWEGLSIIWSVASTQTVAAPPAEEPKKADPQPTPGTKPAPPATNDEPDCDIVRAQLGLPPMRHPVGGTSWKSWVPCKVWLRSVQGPGGGHSYFHTKHRPGCAYQNGLVSPVVREGFLHPTEARGSDVSWWRQVRQDVENTIPPPAPSMPPKTGVYRRDVPGK